MSSERGEWSEAEKKAWSQGAYAEWRNAHVEPAAPSPAPEREAELASLRQQLADEKQSHKETSELWQATTEDFTRAERQLAELAKEREENAKMRSALRNLMVVLEDELTGPAKNIPKSAWAHQWEAAEAALRGAEER